MKEHAFLSVGLILVVSASFWATETPQEARSAPADGLADRGDQIRALAAAGTGGDSGTILFEYYWGATGSVDSLLSLPTFPDRPDERQWRTSLEGPTDWRDNYGTNVRGYLYPPGTGNYTFWIAGDDQSELWLSTDEGPAHAVQIASVPGWTPSGDFDNTGGGAGGPQQKSKPIPLTAGKRYYLQVMHAEGTGGDNLAVAWQGPVIRSRTIIAGMYLSPLIGPEGATDPSLVGWWKLDDGSGTTAYDSSGNSNHAVLDGNPQWVQGYLAGALKIDGQDDYVETNYTENLANWTIIAWVTSPAAPAATAGTGPIHREKNYQMNWNHTSAAFRGAAALSIGGTWHAASFGTLSGNTWYHLAATFDGTALKAYVNGVLITANSAAAGVPDAEVGTLRFGRHSTAAQFFAGTIDEVRLYRRALSPTEIRALVGGLQGEYFTNKTLSGSPAVTRLDPEINFNWGAGEVLPGTSDNCSVRWTGEVEPAFTEPYAFYVSTDDGARLWLDGNLMVDAWSDQASAEHAGQPILLVGGQRYSLRLEWYENTGLAACELRWSSPSTPKQVIPSDRLHPPAPSIGPHIALDPASGPAGTTFAITGSGFAANTSGNVTFAGKSNPVTTTSDGAFSTTMTAPSVRAGNYPVQANIPSGGSAGASADFTVTTSGSTPSVVVSPPSGPPGTTITIAGSGFKATTSGNVTLAGTSTPATTTAAGTFSTTMTAPSVPPGNYPVQADIPSGGSVEASADFTVTTLGSTPSVVVSPPSGPPGTTITIAGSGFRATTSGNVALAGTSKPVATTAAGTFSTTMTVPDVPAGDYPVEADIPSGHEIEASATFTITGPSITLNPVSGSPGTTITITGSSFKAARNGTVAFAGRSTPVTTTAAGTFSTTLTAPNMPAGDYLVEADFGKDMRAYATFTVTGPSITLNPVSGPPGTTITITGSNFRATTSGTVALAGTSTPVTTTAAGTFSTTLTAPNLPAGDYSVEADIPYGHGTEASATFKVSGGLPTSQPGAATTCPAVVTQCPVVSTQCPESFTQCPPTETACQVVDTRCRPVATQCPAVETRCPVVETRCPSGETYCPVVETRCPAVETRCPVAATKCPESFTQCPPTVTQCPVVSTQCPAYLTRCTPSCILPSAASGATTLACPAIDAICPSVVVAKR